MALTSPNVRPISQVKQLVPHCFADLVGRLWLSRSEVHGDSHRAARGEEVYRAIDRTREALTAQATAGFSPLSLSLAYFDWVLHLGAAPGKQLELALNALHKTQQLATSCLLPRRLASVRRALNHCLEIGASPTQLGASCLKTFLLPALAPV
jgi:hypothetical protein